MIRPVLKMPWPDQGCSARHSVELILSESRTKQSKRESKGVYHAFDVIILGCAPASHAGISNMKRPSAAPAKEDVMHAITV